MAVSSSTSQVAVTLTGAEQTVAVPFAWFDDSDLVVVADGEEQTLGTHYEVTSGGNGATSGSITMTAEGPTTGASVVVYRDIPATHTDAWTAGGPMPGTEVTRAIDRLYYLAQQLKRSINLGFTLEVGQPEQSPLALSDEPEVIFHDGDKQLQAKTLADLKSLLEFEDSRWPTWDEVTGKPSSFTPASHNQDWDTIQNKPATATAHPTWDQVTSKPSTFTPASHDHASNKLAQSATHEGADTDSSTSAIHHTLGTGPNQALPGNHASTTDTRTPTDLSVTLAKMAADARGVGMIAPFGGISAPTGWLACSTSGATASRTTYADLFAYLNPSVGAVTISIANPAVVTLTAHGLRDGTPVYFTTDGALPTGITPNSVVYYTRSASADTFNLYDTAAHAVAGGATGRVTTTGSQSGTHTMRRSPHGVGDGSTTFTLPYIPDFIRGYSTDGVDTGRVLGSAQLDAFQGHYHNIKAAAGYGGSSGNVGPKTTEADNGSFVTAPITDGTNGTPRTATETRPRNIALLYCIKY